MKSILLFFLFFLVFSCKSDSQKTTTIDNYKIVNNNDHIEIKDDIGNFGGGGNGTTHQFNNLAVAEKSIIIPNGILDGVSTAFVKTFIGICDYSWKNKGNSSNGYDEEFVMEVNGTKFIYKTNDPNLPKTKIAEDGVKWYWHNFEIPAKVLKYGKNIVRFYKNTNKKYDDGLYVGIDNSVDFNHSRFSANGGKSWSKSVNETQGVKGEYMIRLLLNKNVNKINYLSESNGFSTKLNLNSSLNSSTADLKDVTPFVKRNGNTLKLENSYFSATINVDEHLKFTSIYSKIDKKEILEDPQKTHLLLVKVLDQKIGAEDFNIENVALSNGNGAILTLYHPILKLRAIVNLNVNKDGIEFGLTLSNAGTDRQNVLVAFPQFGGIQISKNINNDYYLFPLWGGVINNENVSLRSYYGDESAWWQMIDLYSSSDGGGVLLRSTDTSGVVKGFAFRKGTDISSPYIYMRNFNSNGGNFENMWDYSLEESPYSSMGIEFQEHSLEFGNEVKFPNSILQFHNGDWHVAMSIYSDWAHSAWNWRKPNPKLKDTWNIRAVGTNSLPLMKGNRWNPSLFNKSVDAEEIWSWWEWSEKGPWNIDINDLGNKLGLSVLNRYKNSWLSKNDKTGRNEYVLNRGDYNYNKKFGSKNGLNNLFSYLNDSNQLSILYMDPNLADGTSQLGKNYGKTYGVYNEKWKDVYNDKMAPKGFVSSFASWHMCIDTKWYQNFLVNQIKRIANDLNVDGIRLDEFGSVGYTCFNPNHQHIFADKGHNAWLKAVSQACALIHFNVDKIKKDFILMTEYPGYDYLASKIDGALDYESAGHVFAFRPIPINLFRFYFPEIKLFDLDSKSVKGGQEWRLWNATGAFGNRYNIDNLKILKENGDAFGSSNIHPLMHSLASNIYINSFIYKDKQVLTLLNSELNNYSGPVFKFDNIISRHCYNLIENVDIPISKDGSINVKIGGKKVEIIALFDNNLVINKINNGLSVNVSNHLDNQKIVLEDNSGKIILEYKNIDSIKLDSNILRKVSSIKLYSGAYLKDARNINY